MTLSTNASDLAIPCPICKGAETKTLLSKFGYPIGRCIKCGMVYATPRMPMELIQARYSPAYFTQEYLPAHGVSIDKPIPQKIFSRYSPLLRVLSNAGHTSGKLLEIGTGAGFFLKAAETAGWSVAGIDISSEAVDFARSRLHLDVRCLSAEEVDFPNGEFDVVVMLEAIEHLYDPRTVVDKIYNFLKTDGALLISTPNFHSISLWGLGQDWAVIHPGEHLFYFTEETLANLLSTVGFRSIKVLRANSSKGPFETMNGMYTHSPRGMRARLYRIFVATMGIGIYPFIRAIGKGDRLLCLASR